MPNVTISVKEELLNSGRNYAQRHNKSLNALIRDLLKQTVAKEENLWLDECFSMMDKAKADSKGHRWKREDLYDV